MYIHPHRHPMHSNTRICWRPIFERASGANNLPAHAVEQGRRYVVPHADLNA